MRGACIRGCSGARQAEHLVGLTRRAEAGRWHRPSGPAGPALRSTASPLDRSGDTTAAAGDFGAHSVAFIGREGVPGESLPATARGHAQPEVLPMDWRDRIVCDPDILVGKPTVKGTRLSVELILGWLAQGWTPEMVVEAYPQLAREDILAALAFAADELREAPSGRRDCSDAWGARCRPAKTGRGRRCWRRVRPRLARPSPAPPLSPDPSAARSAGRCPAAATRRLRPRPLCAASATGGATAGS